MSEDRASEDRLMNRRRAVITGAGALALVGGLRTSAGAVAQEASPVPDESGLIGSYQVIRAYTLVPDANTEEFLATVRGFVEIISAVPGFNSWSAFLNDETRDYVAVSTFDTKENSDASTAAAAQYVADNELASYLVEPTPMIIDGQIVLSAGI